MTYFPYKISMLELFLKNGRKNAFHYWGKYLMVSFDPGKKYENMEVYLSMHSAEVVSKICLLSDTTAGEWFLG